MATTRGLIVTLKDFLDVAINEFDVSPDIDDFVKAMGIPTFRGLLILTMNDLSTPFRKAESTTDETLDFFTRKQVAQLLLWCEHAYLNNTLTLDNLQALTPPSLLAFVRHPTSSSGNPAAIASVPVTSVTVPVSTQLNLNTMPRGVELLSSDNDNVATDYSTPPRGIMCDEASVYEVNVASNEDNPLSDNNLNTLLDNDLREGVELLSYDNDNVAANFIALARVGAKMYSYPNEFELLVKEYELCKPPRKAEFKKWLTEEHMEELEQCKPKPEDVNENGERDTGRLSEMCERIFFEGRQFCCMRQLEAMLHLFSGPWGFTIAKNGKAFFCHYAPSTHASRQRDTPTKRRLIQPSVKNSVKCPWKVSYSQMERNVQNNVPPFCLTEEGTIIKEGLYPVKVTAACNFLHTCDCSSTSQRYAIVKSGKTQPGLDKIREVICLLRDIPEMSSRALRRRIEPHVPSYVKVTSEYLANFRKRALHYYVLNPDNLEKDKSLVQKLIHGEDMAANEPIPTDITVMEEDTRLYLKGLLSSGHQFFAVIRMLDHMKMKEPKNWFDYRIWCEENGRPIGVVWMTAWMKYRLLRYGSGLHLDYMKRQFNKLSWPYCGPVILDGDNEIGVIAESLNLSESIDGYYNVLSSVFDMVPEFQPNSIKLIFSDDFLTPTLLQRLQIDGTAILRCDHYHLLNDVWPKYFKQFWGMDDLQRPLTRMLNSETKIEWDENFRKVLALEFVKKSTKFTGYVSDIYNNPNKYAGYVVRDVPLNLERRGSSHAEQNHSSVVSFLGRGASMELGDQILSLIERQKKLALDKSSRLMKQKMQVSSFINPDPNNILAVDEKEAKSKLTQYAYKSLYSKSVALSKELEVRENKNGSHDVKYKNKPWDDPDTISIAYGKRCPCHRRIAFEFQCSHEYAMSNRFCLAKYDSRWLNEATFTEMYGFGLSSIEWCKAIPPKASILPTVRSDQDTFTNTSIPTNYLTTDVISCALSTGLNSINENNENDSDSIDDHSIHNEVRRSNGVSYQQLRQTLAEVLESTSGSECLRNLVNFMNAATLNFIRNAFSTSDGMAISKEGEAFLMSCLSHFESSLSCLNADFTRRVGCASTEHQHLNPVRARPKQGHTTKRNRIKSVIETRRPSKQSKNNTVSVALCEDQEDQWGFEPSLNPVQRPAPTKTCGFCRQTGHQKTNCPCLSKYGYIMNKQQREELARCIVLPTHYQSQSLPENRFDDVIYDDIPSGAHCLVVHQRFEHNRGSHHPRLLCECSALKKGGDHLTLRVSGTQSSIEIREVDKFLFDAQAIPRFAYKSNDSILISQLVCHLEAACISNGSTIHTLF